MKSLRHILNTWEWSHIHFTLSWKSVEMPITAESTRKLNTRNCYRLNLSTGEADPARTSMSREEKSLKGTVQQNETWRHNRMTMIYLQPKKGIILDVAKGSCNLACGKSGDIQLLICWRGSFYLFLSSIIIHVRGKSNCWPLVWL
jgi:hypothetical protein